MEPACTSTVGGGRRTTRERRPGRVEPTHALLARAWHRAMKAAGLPRARAASEEQATPPDLLDQQLWVWGKDIYAEGGNALRRYGFERCACPEDETGGTQYQLSADQGTLRLWGFGVCWTPADSPISVLLRRYKAEPVLLATCRIPEHVWRASQLPTEAPAALPSVACTLRTTAALCDWIATYERWAWTTLGAGHRRATVAAWHKRRVVSAGRMANAWARLARALHKDP